MPGPVRRVALAAAALAILVIAGVADARVSAHEVRCEVVPTHVRARGPAHGRARVADVATAERACPADLGPAIVPAAPGGPERPEIAALDRAPAARPAPAVRAPRRVRARGPPTS